MKNVEQRAKDKFRRLEAKPTPLRKPEWIRIRLQDVGKISKLKGDLRARGLYTVCEEASCPNLAECYNRNTATFMIMGDKCTRRCSFCDVAHGRPDPLDPGEPARVADAVVSMGLKYVVITSVDRDDLPDGGASHFAGVVEAVHAVAPDARVEILVPDFRMRLDKALAAFDAVQPDVFNHNVETVPRLYKQARPAADYQCSLTLLSKFKSRFPQVPTKSGVMLGLGETDDEVKVVLRDLRAHNVDMLTLGQYLQPSRYHLPVVRYVTPQAFCDLGKYAKDIGFTHVASGPMVRSSYHADLQADGAF